MIKRIPIMKMKKRRQYLLVDDDATSNLICELNIRKLDVHAAINTFNDPEEALACIKDKCVPDDKMTCILFLDINMPGMSGWEFLDAFQNLCSKVREKFRIYVLTSSIEDFTEERMKYSYVSGFLSKPIRAGKLETILREIDTVSL